MPQQLSAQGTSQPRVQVEPSSLVKLKGRGQSVGSWNSWHLGRGSGIEGAGGGTEGRVWSWDFCVRLHAQSTTPGLPDSGCYRVKLYRYKTSSDLRSSRDTRAKTAWQPNTHWDATWPGFKNEDYTFGQGPLQTYCDEAGNQALRVWKSVPPHERNLGMTLGFPQTCPNSTKPKHTGSSEQPATELPARTRMSTLQSQRIESSVSIPCYLQCPANTNIITHAKKQKYIMTHSQGGKKQFIETDPEWHRGWTYQTEILKQLFKYVFKTWKEMY